MGKVHYIRAIAKKVPGLKRIVNVLFYLIRQLWVNAKHFVGTIPKKSDVIMWISPQRIKYAVVDPGIEGNKSPFLIGKVTEEIGIW